MRLSVYIVAFEITPAGTHACMHKCIIKCGDVMNASLLLIRIYSSSLHEIKGNRIYPTGPSYKGVRFLHYNGKSNYLIIIMI